MAKKIFYYFLTYLLMGIFLFGFGEIALRLKGFKPWAATWEMPKVEPVEKFFVSHPTLGYANPPGKFRITLPDGYSFVTTQLPDSHRITHPLNTYPAKGNKPEIWVFGCSFTFGWSLNNEETYPWLLQEMFPEYEVVNFAVSGYGPLKSLIQFREALASGKKPAEVVLAYGAFQDERNTVTRSWKKKISHGPHNDGYIQPFARLDTNGRLKFGHSDLAYHEFPGIRYSALLNFLEDTVNRVQFYIFGSPQVSWRLMLEFQKLCGENGIKFVVAGIYPFYPTWAMLDKLQKKGISTVDISVNVKENTYNNLPHDDHPNALSNRIYAQRIADSLRSTLPDATRTAQKRVLP